MSSDLQTDLQALHMPGGELDTLSIDPLVSDMNSYELIVDGDIQQLSVEIEKQRYNGYKMFSMKLC